MKRNISFKVVSFFFLFALLCCKNYRQNKIDESLKIQTKDSIIYKHLKGRFYTNKYGNIFERKESVAPSGGERLKSSIYFDSSVYVNLGDTIIEKSLSEVLDINTFIDFDSVSSIYSKDKNNVYYSIGSSTNISRFIVSKANQESFKPLSDPYYGIDNRNVFYLGKAISGLNFDKHQILYSLDSNMLFSIEYIKDDKAVYFNGDVVKGADAKTFKLVIGKEWYAEDKNYKYECCGQRINKNGTQH